MNRPRGLIARGHSDTRLTYVDSFADPYSSSGQGSVNTYRAG